MTISGIEAARRVKGWLGLALTLTPFLQFIPVPAIQSIVAPLNEFLLAFVGVGAALQASSPAIIGKASADPVPEIIIKK